MGKLVPDGIRSKSRKSMGKLVPDATSQYVFCWIGRSMFETLATESEGPYMSASRLRRLWC